MSFKFGKRSLKELEGVEPRLVLVAHTAIQISTVDFSIHDGLRTAEEQEEYFASGSSKIKFSEHQIQEDGFGHAFDAVPYIAGKLRWKWSAIYHIAVAVRQAAIQHQVGITWGAVWDKDIRSLADNAKGLEEECEAYASRRRAIGKTPFLDGPHYELRKGGQK